MHQSSVALQAPRYVKHIITSGVLVPSCHVVPASTHSERRLSQNQEFFLDTEVKKMLASEIIGICSDPHPVCHPIFTLPKPHTNEMRFVLDCRFTNNFSEPEKFKVDSIRFVRSTVLKGDFLTKLDLKSAFFHVPLHPRQRRTLCFNWRGVTYNFLVLPFGWNESPVQFDKVISFVTRILRNKGIRLCHYIDDFLIAASSLAQATQHTNLALEIFTSLGWAINSEKSILNPCQVIDYIGYRIDTRRSAISLPKERERNFLKTAKRVMSSNKSGHLTARLLASWIGQLASICDVFSQADFRRHSATWLLNKTLASTGASWKSIVCLDQRALSDIAWWISPQAKGYLTAPLKIPPVDVTQISDSSASGWAAHLVKNNLTVAKTFGHWNLMEGNRSSNQSELHGIVNGYFALSAKSPNLHHVMFLSDNTTAGKYASRGGGKKPTLSLIAEPMIRHALSNKIHLSFTHIKGEDNPTDADSRRARRLCDFALPLDCFATIVRNWGRPSIDLFATRLSTKCAKFVSLMPDPKSWMGRHNALSLDWANLPDGVPYAFPPFSLLHRVIYKILESRRRIILVAPDWPGHRSLPLILPICVSTIQFGEVALAAADQVSPASSISSRLIAYFLDPCLPQL